MNPNTYKRFIARYRLPIIVTAYVSMYLLCYLCAYLLRFDFDLPESALQTFWRTLPILLALKAASCLMTREWWRRFRHTTLTDLAHAIVGATGVAAILYAINPWLTQGPQIPRSVIAIDFLMTILATSVLRSAIRFYVEAIQPRIAGLKKNRTLIYGSCDSSMAILKAVQSSLPDYQVVGFIDETLPKGLSLAAGVPVFPANQDLTRTARDLRATHVMISGTVPGKRVRELLAICQDYGLKANVIPGVDEIVDGRFKLTIRDVTISDLLRREPVKLDVAGIRAHVEGARVLVTGAAGSIGSELCRQILAMQPDTLVLVDQSEFGIFTIQQELEQLDRAETELVYVVGDVLDEVSMSRVMFEQQPQLIFHAAAYKHVPLMQTAPQEAIRNNIFGTRNMVDLAHEHGVSRFVLISTDKAVRPSSVMGCTKLVAEKYLQSVAARSETSFITVRFGNVLNSAGSVVPTFRRQIEAGGPVTVTHPEMKRYFMTIPEAVQLVLQAGAIGNSGDVLILDMGEPVRILDLARDMIYLSGLRSPEDIEIVFTGTRPGEKLYEELFYSCEEGAKRVHEKIFRAPREMVDPATITADLQQLRRVISAPRDEALRVLTHIVDSYVDADDTVTAPVPRAA